jgi:hypothetical protein
MYAVVKPTTVTETKSVVTEKTVWSTYLTTLTTST